MNVHDYLKPLSEQEIKMVYKDNSMNAAIGMTHISGDFNLSNVIRSANFFGFREVFYIGGKKHWDRRGAVGTHHYIPVNFISTEEDFITLIKPYYTLVCIENNIDKYKDKTVSIFDKNLWHYPGNFFDHRNVIFVFGEEQKGLSEYMLNQADKILTIPAFGTVRSLNIASAAAIVMANYREYKQNAQYKMR